MIISIGNHIKDIVSKLDSMPEITSLLPWWIYFNKPKEKDSTYMYLSLVDDNIKTKSNRWSIIKVARLSFHIVGWTEDVLPNTLYTIVDVITNEIVTEQCGKIEIDNLKLVDIEEWPIWPVFTIEKNKPYIVKDYFFTYYAR